MSQQECQPEAENLRRPAHSGNFGQPSPRQADNLTRLAMRALSRHRSGMAGLVITVLFLLVALLAPALAPFDELEIHASDRFQPPSAIYLMGTDEFGRDILSRILIGSRISFSVGLVSVAIACSIGVSIGLTTGYIGGWYDNVTMRLFDSLLAFPAILLAIVIMAVLGQSPFNAMLAVAIVNIPIFARLTRGIALCEVNKEYVEAARAIGAGNGRIMFRSILPNVIPNILVQITVSFATAVLLEASLSFLGLGTPLPAPSWGSMLHIGRGYLQLAPWYSIFPGLALMWLVMGVYLLGDGLRDALDPRRQKLV
jgi:peptide/nickel transport system permease protein